MMTHFYLIMTDLLWLGLALVQLVVFSVGFRTILRRQRLFEADQDLVVCGAFGILVITAMATLLGIFDLPTAWWAAFLGIAIQLLGFFGIHEVWRKVCAVIRNERWYWLVAITVLLILPIGLWVKMFADLPGLPSAHDGMSHSAFFMTLVNHGNALLHRNPMELTEYFGFARPAYYPTGTHLIAAVFELPWIWLGWLNQAQALKTWQLLHVIFIPAMVGWISARSFPKSNRWLWLLNGIFALGYFWYPGFATDSGGFSRSMALFLTLPLVISLLTCERDRSFEPWFALMIGLGLFATFPYHTAATCFFGFSALIVGLIHIAEIWKDRRRCFGFVLMSAVAFGLSAAALIVLLRDSSGVEQIDSANAVLHDAEFSLGLLLERWRVVFVTAYGNYFPIWKSFPLPFAIRPVVVGLGVLGVGFGLVRATTQVPRRVLIYPVLFSLISLFLAYVYYAPSRVLYRIGLMFLNYPGRLAELNYLAVVIITMMGLMVAAGLLKKLYEMRDGRLWRFAVGVGAVYLIGLSIREHRDQIVMTSRHLEHWWGTYWTPRHSSTGELARFIESETEANALLVYPEHFLGSLIPRTHRRGILVYNECPHNNNENCARRIEFAKKIGDEFGSVLSAPDPANECLVSGKELKKFYVLNPTQMDRPSQLVINQMICKNLRYLGRIQGVDVAVADFGSGSG
jgi:hypothetical protein